MEKNYITISLADPKYFQLQIGKRVLVKDLHNKKPHKIFGKMALTVGEKNKIPLYSSNPFITYGFVEKTNITINFSNPYILWGIDGEFEFNLMKKGTQFATTDHCGSMEILAPNILPEYLLMELNLQKAILAFDRTLRPSLELMKNKVTVEMPINEEGKPDLEAQKELVNKYKPIVIFKDKIKKIEDEIASQNLIYEPQYQYAELPLCKVFTITQGNMFYTKKRILENKWEGDIPVYSSNTEDEGVLLKIREDKILPEDLYYQNCLTWSIDGSYVGKMFIRNQNNILNEKKKKFFFTANNHCGILLPLHENLYMAFFKYTLEPEFMLIAKGEGRQKLGTNQINEMMIKIPIDKDKKFDLEKQKEIARVFESVENTKNELLTQLRTIKEQQISITR